ncbi:MAG: hypothetical protein IPN47_19345 [Gemmatimonadetes bacterium]|nr:hypothetical protein [Gemmatimonadota bacterium]
MRRYVSYFDVNGAPTVVRFDLGSPGKVSGSIAGSTLIAAGAPWVKEWKQEPFEAGTARCQTASLTASLPDAVWARSASP